MPEDIHARLLAARAEMRDPAIDSTNPHFNSRFASLASVLNAVRPPLLAHGLMLSQQVGRDEFGPFIDTVVADATGESVSLGRVPLSLSGTPQQNGSELTYMRRYALMATFALVGDPDDDGEAASVPRPAKCPPGKVRVRCRHCGAERFISPENFESFSASDYARCCASPAWVMC